MTAWNPATDAFLRGIERIVIVTGRGKNAIEDHFDTSFELEKMLEDRGKEDLLAIVREISDMIPVSYVRQKTALGLGHAILQAKDLVGKEPFAVMLGDDIVDSREPCIGQMMRLYEKRGNPVIAIQEVAAKERELHEWNESLLRSMAAVSSPMSMLRTMVSAESAPVGRPALRRGLWPSIGRTPTG